MYEKTTQAAMRHILVYRLFEVHFAPILFCCCCFILPPIKQWFWRAFPIFSSYFYQHRTHNEKLCLRKISNFHFPSNIQGKMFIARKLTPKGVCTIIYMQRWKYIKLCVSQYFGINWESCWHYKRFEQFRPV